VLGFELPQSILLWLLWRWGSHELSAQVGLLISASQVSRITGMSHQGPAQPYFLHTCLTRVYLFFSPLGTAHRWRVWRTIQSHLCIWTLSLTFLLHLEHFPLFWMNTPRPF
jgi:hypothetical protein